MERRAICTEVGDQNREIREQNKLLDQMEVRLTRLNAWAQFEKKMDATLSTDLAARLSTYEDRKNYQRYYNAWSKLTGTKRSTFEERYER